MRIVGGGGNDGGREGGWKRGKKWVSQQLLSRPQQLCSLPVTNSTQTELSWEIKLGDTRRNDSEQTDEQKVALKVSQSAMEGNSSP